MQWLCQDALDTQKIVRIARSWSTWSTLHMAWEFRLVALESFAMPIGPTWSNNGQSRGKSPDVQRNRCLTLATPSIFFGVGDFFRHFWWVKQCQTYVCSIPDGHLPGTNGLGPRPRLLQHLGWHRTVPGENFGGNWPQNDAMGIGGFYHSLPIKTCLET
jgi:hypothetical protein